MNRKIVTILVAEIAVLAFIYLLLSRAAGGFGFPLDDSWIHSHFARNIAEGRGIVYNPGQHVTSTAILYSLALAGLYAITHSPVFNAMALGLVLHVGASVLIYATARRLSIGPGLSLTAAAFFAAIPRLVWGALSGMEVPLYVFLVTLGIYWHVRYSWRDGAKSYISTLAFGLATLARPECAVFLVCSVVARSIEHIRSEKTPGRVLHLARTLPVHALVFIAVIAPVSLYNLASYGLPLPPAFYAKTRALGPTQEGHFVTTSLQKTATYLGETATVIRRDNMVMFVLLIPGLIGCVRMMKRTDNRGILLLPLALILLPTATAFAAPMGPHRSLAQMFCQHGRYTAYLCPLVALIAIIGIVEMRRAVQGMRRGPSLNIALTGIVACAVVVTLATSNWGLAHSYALEVQNINDMQVTLGKWAAGLPRGTVIAVNDAGAIAYFSRLRILDTVGVVNPEVIPYLNRNTNRQPGLLQYLQERKPDYVIIFPTWYPQIAQRRDLLHPIKSVKLGHNIVCGGREMVVYRPTWH